MTATTARAAGLTLLLTTGAALGACGEEAAERPVRLEVTAPADAVVVRDDSVEVRGRVRPREARVLVRGRPATVTDGQFRARVPLRAGANVIDVAGAAQGAAPAWTALRVSREVVVTVPDLTGAPPDDAIARLERDGLRVAVEEDDGLLDDLFGGEPAVCDIEPEPGTQLRRGALVEITVSRTC